MKLLPRVPLLLLLAACAPTNPPEAPTVTAAPPPPGPVETAAPAAPMPLPPLDPSLPAGSAGLASIDVGRLDAIANAAVRGMEAPARERIEELLRLSGGALANGEIARLLGLDKARPIVGSVGLVGPAAVARERILPLIGKQATAGELRRAFEGVSGLAVAARVVLPTTRDTAALNVLTAIFELARWSSVPPPDGFDELHVARKHKAAAALSRLPDAIVVDLVVPIHARDGDKAAQEAIVAALRSIRLRTPGDPHDAPLPLEGHPARARYKPAALADIGLLQGVSAVLRAIDGSGIDPAQQDALAAQGLVEAARSQELAGAGGRAYFESVDLALDGGFGSIGFTGAAELGPAANLPAATFTPAPGIAIPGVFAMLDVGMPWARGFSSFKPDPLDGEAVDSAAREAGWAGFAVGLPQLLVYTILQPHERLLDLPNLRPHLDRLTIFTVARERPDGHVALLVPGAKPADVACALVRQGGACDATSQLRPGTTAQIGGRYARLVQVKGRWAIVISNDKAVVEKTKLDLVPVPPAHIDLPGGEEWARDLRPLPAALMPREGFTGEVRLEGRTVVAQLRPAPAKEGKAPAKKR
jgi:hypothetical protein